MSGFARIMLMTCLFLVSAQSDHHQGGRFTQKSSKDGTHRSVQSSGDPIDISYKECSPVLGSCKVINKKIPNLPPLPPTADWEIEMGPVHHHRRRGKRHIFGEDNRLRIRYPNTHRYPFSSVVAIRTNVSRCSGIALRPNMFLTAAHCISPINREAVSDIAVGTVSNGSDTTMTWVPVSATKINVNWEGRTDNRRFLYDYALVETTEPLQVDVMKVALIGRSGRGHDVLKKRRPFMFFSAYDDREIPGVLRLRNCRMSKVTTRMIYSKCDTVAETAGAGVYLNVRSRRNYFRGEKMVIAIDTGDLQTGSKLQQRFSAALRISRRRFAQICFWITQDYQRCGGRNI